MFTRLDTIPEGLGNIDGIDYPANIPVRITSNPKLRADIERVLATETEKTITLDKEYRIHKITSYGDPFDVWFTNDLGQEEQLGEWWFEDID